MSFAWTYADLKVEVASALGYTRDSAQWPAGSNRLAVIVACIKSGLSRFYTSYDWSFFRPVSSITLSASYTTGTVTVAAGVVTLVGGTFPSWAADGEMSLNGEAYTVASRDGDAQVTLDDTSVTETDASTYVLERAFYDLPSDFSAVDGVMIYRPSGSTLYPPVSFTTNSALLQMRQGIFGRSGPPLYYTVRSKAFVVATGQRYELDFYPRADSAYELFYRYRVQPVMLSSDTDYPLGGPVHSETVLEACLSIIEERYQAANPTGIHIAKYQECLARSIQHDKNVISPDMMPNSRPEDQLRGDPTPWWTSTGQRYVTVAGVRDWP